MQSDYFAPGIVLAVVTKAKFKTRSRSVYEIEADARLLRAMLHRFSRPNSGKYWSAAFFGVAIHVNVITTA